MSRLQALKAVIIFGWAVSTLLWVATISSSKAPESDEIVAQSAQEKGADYVGTETCRTCHEQQGNHFAKTAHAKLENNPTWKGKVVGCEACHGPGSAHLELISSLPEGAKPGPTGQLKIRSLKHENETSKQISETCLVCHDGKEEHNNFRRGEHWRNNVGCSDCHSAHSPDVIPPKPESAALIAIGSRQRMDVSVLKQLKDSEPQLCLKCHSEQRAQFTMPFRHKVLEGVMKCSDCHNPHGGFETKQQRLTTGTDAACSKCHTDKQGPFIFEHSPVKVEGCAICHTPHGSNNPKLLVRSRVFQLCIECHSNAHQLVLREGGEGAPNPPGFHNLTQERIRNCTSCHTAIHGSNSHNFFFR
jgi:predicted CXXCH cytochrome family protein